MLDYKNIIIKRYALKLSYNELAKEFGRVSQESMTSLGYSRNVTNFLILFRRESLIMPFTSWSTVMHQAAILEVPSMNNQTLSMYSGR